jgi:beta-N-acetylhexosaminidase
MTILQSLRKKPFYLDDAAIAWVESTLLSLSVEEKVRQLFVQISIGDSIEVIDQIMGGQPGGIHRFAGANIKETWAATRRALELSKVPLLVTGDLEGGGAAPAYLTPMQSQIGIAAADDLELSEQLLANMALECKALGYNWSFTPVVDINQNFQSAVVGTRSYGSDVATIEKQALVHVATLQAYGIAATAKHWPGEGLDQRDQHLVTTINPMSFEEWEASFGRLYASLIDAGVMSVMSAHIAFPAYAEKCGVPEGLERYRPASVSALLNDGLLRQHLGFNGLIVSDATPMAGLGSWNNAQSNAVDVIKNGCDVFLFSDDYERDVGFVLSACQDGRIPSERLNEAITRVLGLKAALKLHVMTLDQRMATLTDLETHFRSSQGVAVAQQLTAKSIDLVKDVRGTLPLSLEKHRRIVLIDNGATSMLPHIAPKHMSVFANELTARGFEVRNFDANRLPTHQDTDLLIYLFAAESSLIRSRIFIDWKHEHGGFHQAMQRFWHEMPTVMVSFGHPYYLYDAPRVPTYVNAWSPIDDVQAAVVRKLCGDEPFEGNSPVDAFCGLPDARY